MFEFTWMLRTLMLTAAVRLTQAGHDPIYTNLGFDAMQLYSKRRTVLLNLTLALSHDNLTHSVIQPKLS